jgi:hypothetical protein
MNINHNLLQLIDKNNDRQCQWVFNFLRNNRIVPVSMGTPATTEMFYKLSCQALDDYNWQSSEKVNLLLDIQNRMQNQLLEDTKYEWIDIKNNLQCSWCWNYLYSNKRIIAGNHAPTLTERRKHLIYSLDNWAENFKTKGHLLVEMENHWIKIFRSISKFDWLEPKNTSQCKWAWEKLKNGNPNRALPQLTPRCDSEYYCAVIVSILEISQNDDTTTLFVEKLKRAWRSKTYRDRLNGKKTYNIVMSVDIKEKLDKLAKHNEKKINATLESIIDREYRRIFDDTRS